MKNTWEKHKIVLISGGIVLSLMISIPLINNKAIVNNKEEDDKNAFSSIESKEMVEETKTKEIYPELEVYKMEKDKKIEEDKETKEENVKEEVEASEKNKKELENIREKADKLQSAKKDSQSPDKVSSTKIIEEKYSVKKGDTLFLIAERASTSVDKIKTLNNLNTDIIEVDQKLNLKETLQNQEQATPSQQLVSRGNARENDLYWLSRIIHSEAQGEPYEGKVAVGNVIINRVSSRLFPDTIKGVVFDKQNGYTQFSPVIYGTIYDTPDSASIKAAEEVLNGARPVGSALYFLNPRKSTNFWITKNREYMKTISQHDFYY